jgi:hypothetical protein
MALGAQFDLVSNVLNERQTSNDLSRGRVNSLPNWSRKSPATQTLGRTLKFITHHSRMSKRWSQDVQQASFAQAMRNATTKIERMHFIAVYSCISGTGKVIHKLANAKNRVQ